MIPQKTQPVATPEQLKKADKKIGIVHIFSGKTGEGEDFYAYISIKPSRYEDFMLIAKAGEEMNLQEFGEILKKGFGKEPSAEIMRQMEEKYGVDHNFIGNLQKEIEKQQQK